MWTDSDHIYKYYIIHWLLRLSRKYLPLEGLAGTGACSCGSVHCYQLQYQEWELDILSLYILYLLWSLDRFSMQVFVQSRPLLHLASGSDRQLSYRFSMVDFPHFQENSYSAGMWLGDWLTLCPTQQIRLASKQRVVCFQCWPLKNDVGKPSITIVEGIYCVANYRNINRKSDHRLDWNGLQSAMWYCLEMCDQKRCLTVAN